MAKLNEKQEAFCLEYLIDLNATQSAIRAGYSEKTARAIGCELLTKPNIQDKIAELKKERSEQTKIDAQYVLRRFIEIDQMDVIDIMTDDLRLKPISEWPDCWRKTISGLDISSTIKNFDEENEENILKKIKWPDKVKNLELLGKHVDVQAFLTKQETKVTLSDDFDSLLSESLNDEE